MYSLSFYLATLQCPGLQCYFRLYLDYFQDPPRRQVWEPATVLLFVPMFFLHHVSRMKKNIFAKWKASGFKYLLVGTQRQFCIHS
jgi:hypothetical protein